MTDTDCNAPVPTRSIARRLRNVFLALLIGLLAALVTAEGVVRFLLFSDSDLAVEWGKDLRAPRKLTAGIREQEFWRLKSLWSGPKKSSVVRFPDKRVGWVSPAIVGPEFQHRARKGLGARRPFLMFGDSFTACMVPDSECWQGLLSKGPLGSQLSVINYAVKGHGLGQIYLVLKQAIDNWADQGSVVSVGVLIADDMDRVPLGLRGGVKPQFGIDKGELVIEIPESLDMHEWVNAYSPPARSYLWSYLLYGTELIPKSWEAPRLEDPAEVQLKKDLAALLVGRIQEELESRGLDYFFVLFEDRSGFANRMKKTGDWRRRFLTQLLDERKIPWVDAGRALDSDRKLNKGRRHKDYFLPPGTPGAGHYNAMGNSIVWKSIERALHGAFDGIVKELPRDPTQRKPAVAPR